MNLLVLSSRPPWPPAMADQMTVDRMVRFLVERGHRVDLLCFVEDEAQDATLREGLGSVCREIETVTLPKWQSYASTAATLPFAKPMQTQYFRSVEMRRAVERRVREGDYHAVYTHLIRMAEYTRHLKLPKLIGFQVSQALNLERMVSHASSPVRKAFYWIEASKVRPYEAGLCADYDRSRMFLADDGSPALPAVGGDEHSGRVFVRRLADRHAALHAEKAHVIQRGQSRAS